MNCILFLLSNRPSNNLGRWLRLPMSKIAFEKSAGALIKVFLLPQLFKQNRWINSACFSDSREPFHTFNRHLLEYRWIFSARKPLRVSVWSYVRRGCVLSPVSSLVFNIRYATIRIHTLSIENIVSASWARRRLCLRTCVGCTEQCLNWGWPDTKLKHEFIMWTTTPLIRVFKCHMLVATLSLFWVETLVKE